MTYRPVLNDLSTLPSSNNFLNGRSTQIAKRGRLYFALSTVAVLSNSIRAFFVCLQTYVPTVSKLVVWKANGNLLQGSVIGFKIAPPSSGRGSTSCKLPDNTVIDTSLG